VYGHFGPPVVVFPSAAGFAHEWDRQGMLAVLAPLVDGGVTGAQWPIGLWATSALSHVLG